MSRADEALTVSCSLCHAKVKDPCTYVTEVKPRYRYHYNGKVPAARTLLQAGHLVGDPTKQPHFQRMSKVMDKRDKELRADALRRAIKKTPVALFSLREFDRLEHEKLRAWLHSNYTLFKLRRLGETVGAQGKDQGV